MASFVTSGGGLDLSSSFMSELMERSSSITTAVRIRPPSSAEIRSEYRSITSLDGSGASETSLQLLDPTFFSRKRDYDQRYFERQFKYDFCFSQDATQEQVFLNVGRPLLQHAFEGFNCCILAYGQTGSGKSYTMIGQEGEDIWGTETGTTSEIAGVIPRLCQSVLESVQQKRAAHRRLGPSVAAVDEPETSEVESGAGADTGDAKDTRSSGMASQRLLLLDADVFVSFYEIYNEKVHDLLSSKPEQPCRVREHPEDGAYVEGITLCPVKSAAQAAQIMNHGLKQRAVAETRINAVSSRSHAVYTIYLRQKLVRKDRMKHLNLIQQASSYDKSKEKDEPYTQRNSKITLVDLAGSERVSLTGATGERLVEANNINKSLSTLSDVIKALSDRGAAHSSKELGMELSPSKPRDASAGLQVFVPYRNSVLTWLLKDCLGGNARTSMLANISPCENAYNETMSTLRYVERAKLIMNVARVNETSTDPAYVQHLQKQVAALKERINELSAGSIQQTEQHRADLLSVEDEVERRFLERTEQMREQLTYYKNREAGGFPSRSASESANESSSSATGAEIILLKTELSQAKVLREQQALIIAQYEASEGLTEAAGAGASTPRSPAPDRMKGIVLSYKREKDAISQQYDDLLEKFRALTQDFETSREQADRMEYNRSSITADLSLARADRNRLKSDLAQRTEEINLKNAELEYFKSRLASSTAEYRKKLSSMEVYISRARDSESALRHEKETDMDKFTEILAEKQKAVDEVDTRIAEVEAACQSKTEAAEAKLIAAVREKDRLREQLQVKMGEADRAQTALEDMHAAFELQKEEQVSEQKNFAEVLLSLADANDTMGRLEKDVEDLQLEKSQFSSRMQEMHAIQESLQQQSHGLSVEKTFLQEQLHKETSEKVSAKQLLYDMSAKSESLQQRLHAETADKESLQQRLIAETADKESLQQQLIAENAVKESMQHRLNAETADKESLQQRLITETADKESLQQQLIAENAVKESMQHRLNAETADKESLQQQLTAETAEKVSTKLNLDAMTATNATLLSTIDELKLKHKQKCSDMQQASEEAAVKAAEKIAQRDTLLQRQLSALQSTQTELRSLTELDAKKQEELALAKEAEESLHKEVFALRDEIQVEKKHEHELEDQLTAEKAEESKLHDLLHQTELKLLEEKAAEDALRKKVLDGEKDFAATHAKLSESVRAEARLIREKEVLDKEVSRLETARKAEAEEAESRLTTAREALAQAEAKVDHLTALQENTYKERQAADAQLEKSTGQVDSLQKEVARLEQLVLENDSVVKHLVKKREEEHEELHRLRLKAAAEERAHGPVGGAEVTIRALREQVGEAEDRIEELQKEKAALQSATETSEDAKEKAVLEEREVTAAVRRERDALQQQLRDREAALVDRDAAIAALQLQRIIPVKDNSFTPTDKQEDDGLTGLSMSEASPDKKKKRSSILSGAKKGWNVLRSIAGIEGKSKKLESSTPPASPSKSAGANQPAEGQINYDELEFRVEAQPTEREGDRLVDADELARSRDGRSSTAVEAQARTNRFFIPPSLKASEWKAVHSMIRWENAENMEKLRELIATKPSIVFLQDPRSRNLPIHIAAQNGHVDATALLIASKVDVNAQNSTGQTPLHMAMAYDYRDIVKMLLEAGADESILNHERFPAITGIDGSKSFGILTLKYAQNAADVNSAFDMLSKQLSSTDVADFVRNSFNARRVLGSTWGLGLSARFATIFSGIREYRPFKPTPKEHGQGKGISEQGLLELQDLRAKLAAAADAERHIQKEHALQVQLHRAETERLRAIMTRPPGSPSPKKLGSPIRASPEKGAGGALTIETTTEGAASLEEYSVYTHDASSLTEELIHAKMSLALSNSELELMQHEAKNQARVEEELKEIISALRSQMEQKASQSSHD